MLKHIRNFPSHQACICKGYHIVLFSVINCSIKDKLKGFFVGWFLAAISSFAFCPHGYEW